MDIFEYMKKVLNLEYISDLRFLKNSDQIEKTIAVIPAGRFSESEIRELKEYVKQH